MLRRNLKAALRAARLDEANDLLERLKSEAPLDPVTRGFELELLIASKHYQEAKSLADQLEQHFPNSSRIHFLVGKLAYRQKNYQKATAAFRESHRIYPHWRSQYWLGKTLTQSGALDEARTHLETVRPHFPPAARDLAWLYERKGDLEKALEYYEEVLRFEEDSSFTAQQVARVKAKMLRPEVLVDEVETLVAFGESIPDSIFPEYIANLLKTGQGDKARRLIHERLEQLSARLATSVGWDCYRAHAYDLTYDLFSRFIMENRSQFKLLNALEVAAKKCHRVEALIESYLELAPLEKNFYGRIKKLEKTLL